MFFHLLLESLRRQRRRSAHRLLYAIILSKAKDPCISPAQQLPHSREAIDMFFHLLLESLRRQRRRSAHRLLYAVILSKAKDPCISPAATSQFARGR